MALLELENVSKYFGGLAAVSELALSIEQGEILGLIGPNGAGKTTVFNVITGVYEPTVGRVIFDGEDITGLKPNIISQKGIIRTFQLTSLFREHTVLGNVLIGFHLHSKAGFWRSLANTPYSRREEGGFREKALAILSSLGIEHLKDEHAMNLPHGHTRVVGVAVALAPDPRILLLDEPMTGMNPAEVAAQVDRVRRIREERGISIVVVEHNMRAVMGVCDRIIAMNFGRKIAEGSPEEIRENPAVIEAYLGVEGRAP